MTAGAPSSTLFESATARAVELGDDDIRMLQQFFEHNPAYFLSVNGENPTPDEARSELHAALPDGWSFTWKRSIGFLDHRGRMIAMANVVADLFARGVWHIGLFIVDTSLHGTGAARALLESLERWAAAHGAQWLRLGVVKGNARAERFWTQCGYVDLRTREGVPMGKRVNDVRVLAKPLTGATLAEYLAAVPRDNPEHP
jgi:GNAT superfamily N-acetyltransferase